MKYFRVLMLFALAFGLHAEDNRRDGNWWRERAETDKAAYVIGFFDGMDLGENMSWWNIPKKDGGALDPAVSLAVSSFEDIQKQYFKSVTNVQISDGLDKLYEDYRNRTIPLRNGIWLVVNSISGKTDKEMTVLIENFRKGANR